MNRENLSHAPVDDCPFPPQLNAALRGGASLIACTFVCENILHWRFGYFVDTRPFLLTAWLAFPLGALLGCLLPRWVDKRSSAFAALIGIVAGLAAGLFLAAIYWIFIEHNGLIGLRNKT